MTDLPDANEFGGLGPGVLDRSVIALTSRMPNNWLAPRDPAAPDIDNAARTPGWRA
jgi:hypothetical protein